MKKNLFFNLVVLALILFACNNNAPAPVANIQEEVAVEQDAVEENSVQTYDDETVDLMTTNADSLFMDQSPDGTKILYVSYTDEDRSFNKEGDPEDEMFDIHNTLFLFDKNTNTTKIIKTKADDRPEYFYGNDIQEAKFSKDGTKVFIINDPHTYTYFNALCYDLEKDKLIYLSDGMGITEGDDGLLYVGGAKGYYEEEGAYWYIRIMTCDGETVGGSDTIQ